MAFECLNVCMQLNMIAHLTVVLTKSVPEFDSHLEPSHTRTLIIKNKTSLCSDYNILKTFESGFSIVKREFEFAIKNVNSTRKSCTINNNRKS